MPRSLKKIFAEEAGIELAEMAGIDPDDQEIYDDILRSFNRGRKMEEDKVDDSLVVQALKEFAELATADMEADALNGQSFMLSAPATLTVVTAKGYSKRSHIGGEDFAPVSCYIGKRGRPIFVFKPIMATDYNHIEMTHADAIRSLTGFEEWLVETRLDKVLFEAFNAQSKELERKQNEEKFNQYGDFGSW